MDMLLGVSGFLGFIACLIGLIIAAVRKKPKKRILLGVVFCFILFFVGVLLPSDNTPGQSTQAANQSNQTSQEQSQVSSSSSATDGAIKVDYKTLYKDYSDNPINADKTYKDKLLSLTGTIANIDRDIGKNPYITFNVDEYGAQSIKMSFDSDDTVAALKKGQTVTVVGTCDGTFASTIVVLSKCEIVK